MKREIQKYLRKKFTKLIYLAKAPAATKIFEKTWTETDATHTEKGKYEGERYIFKRNL